MEFKDIIDNILGIKDVTIIFILAWVETYYKKAHTLLRDIDSDCNEEILHREILRNIDRRQIKYYKNPDERYYYEMVLVDKRIVIISVWHNVILKYSRTTTK